VIFDLGFLICELASRPGAAPGRLSFGDSAALLVRGFSKS
jgi:hypothetical protein